MIKKTILLGAIFIFLNSNLRRLRINSQYVYTFIRTYIQTLQTKSATKLYIKKLRRIFDLKNKNQNYYPYNIYYTKVARSYIARNWSDYMKSCIICSVANNTYTKTTII